MPKLTPRPLRIGELEILKNKLRILYVSSDVYFAKHEGKQLVFSSLHDARTFAGERGYTGIHVLSKGSTL